MFKMFTAAVAAILLAGSAQAFDFSAAIGGGVVNAGNVAGSNAQSGILGGSALAGVTTGTAVNQSTSVAGTQSTAVLGSNGFVGTVINQHQNTSVSSLNSASLGLAGNVGGASGSAGSFGVGNVGGGFLGLNVNLQP